MVSAGRSPFEPEVARPQDTLHVHQPLSGWLNYEDTTHGGKICLAWRQVVDAGSLPHRCRSRIARASAGLIERGHRHAN